MPLAAGRWNLLNSAVIFGTPLAAAILLPWGIANGKVGLLEIGFCLAFVFVIGTAISAGYHRLFSHRAFEASWPFRLANLLIGAASFENSALKWSSDHRLHHRFVDTDRDPYDARRGFWWSHAGWVVRGEDPPMEAVADLEKDPLVRWQHRNIFAIGVAVGVVFPLLVGLAVGNVVGFAIAGVLLRIVLTHHTTFLINSAAHIWGSRPYSDRSSARDNGWLAVVTYGEGYHNFHHTWAFDYRNGHRWYQWDTTKWLLGLLAPLGVVWNLRRVSPAAVERARVRMEEKELRRRLAEKPAAASLADRLTEAGRRLDEALAAASRLGEAWEAKKAELRTAGEARGERWRAYRAEKAAAFARQREEIRKASREWRRVCSEAHLTLAS